MIIHLNTEILKVSKHYVLASYEDNNEIHYQVCCIFSAHLEDILSMTSMHKDLVFSRLQTAGTLDIKKMVLVEGLPSQVPNLSFLEVMFGGTVGIGGPIESLNVDAVAGRARITFANAKGKVSFNIDSVYE